MRISKYTFSAVIVSVFLSGCVTTAPTSKFSNVKLEQLLSAQSESAVPRESLAISTLAKAKKDLSEGRVKSALKHANLALRFKPDYSEAKIVAAKAKIANGKYAEGALDFKNLVATDPVPENFQFLGISHYYLNDYVAAEMALTKAIEEDATLWRAASLLGRIKSQNKDFSKADEMFALALRYENKSAAVYDHMGHSYTDREAWEQAVQQFESAQSLSGGNSGRHDKYRLAMANSGKLSTVLRDATSDETGRLYRDLGQDALKKGRKTKAVSHLKRAQSSFTRHDKMTQDLLQQALNLPS